MSLLLERTVNLHHAALQQAYSVLKENYYFNCGAGKRCCNWSYQNICYDCISSETFFGIVRHMVQQGVRFTLFRYLQWRSKSQQKFQLNYSNVTEHYSLPSMFKTSNPLVNYQNLQSKCPEAPYWCDLYARTPTIPRKLKFQMLWSR